MTDRNFFIFHFYEDIIYVVKNRDVKCVEIKLLLNLPLSLSLSDAPQLSPSSSCNTTQDLILCSCEVHGNPSPKLEWRVSGQSSSATSEESVNKTTSRSFISIRQSFTDVLTLQCVVSNNLGISTQFFYFKKVAPHSAKGEKHQNISNLNRHFFSSVPLTPIDLEIQL